MDLSVGLSRRKKLFTGSQVWGGIKRNLRYTLRDKTCETVKTAENKEFLASQVFTGSQVYPKFLNDFELRGHFGPLSEAVKPVIFLYHSVVNRGSRLAAPTRAVAKATYSGCRSRRR